ncbi:MAG: DUF2442 domain-containing protein [Devosia sp.]|nr:DUF2442 domain-containing protein [Devosia sp.]
MSTLTIEREPLATDVSFSGSMLQVKLDDGRELAVPLDWFPRLHDGSPAARLNWRFIGHGEGIHWPDLDEDISVLGLLAGRRRGKRAA